MGTAEVNLDWVLGPRGDCPETSPQGAITLHVEGASHLSETPKLIREIAEYAICQGLDVTYRLGPDATPKNLGPRCRIVAGSAAEQGHG